MRKSKCDHRSNEVFVATQAVCEDLLLSISEYFQLKAT